MADWWGKQAVVATVVTRVLKLVVCLDLMLGLQRAAVSVAKMAPLMVDK